MTLCLLHVSLTRDEKCELTLSQFDKLLDPEQLKIYNKYASVLGRLVDQENWDMREFITNPYMNLPASARGTGPLLFIIDALDRCNTAFLREILEAFQTCAEKLPLYLMISAKADASPVTKQFENWDMKTNTYQVFNV